MIHLSYSKWAQWWIHHFLFTLGTIWASNWLAALCVRAALFQRNGVQHVRTQQTGKICFSFAPASGFSPAIPYPPIHCNSNLLTSSYLLPFFTNHPLLSSVLLASILHPAISPLSPVCPFSFQFISLPFFISTSHIVAFLFPFWHRSFTVVVIQLYEIREASQCCEPDP